MASSISGPERSPAAAAAGDGRAHGAAASRRHRIEFAAYRAAKRFVLARPHEAVAPVGRRLGRFAYRTLLGRRRLVLSNLALALPELDEAERRRIARGCFEHFGAYFCELVSISRFSPAELATRFEVEGWEHLEPLAAAGPLLLMSAHHGSWEMAAPYLGTRLGPLDIVARPPNNPLVATDLAVMRERYGHRIVAKRGAARKMVKALRAGGRVGLAIDQRVRRSAAIRVPFFGHPAWTTPVLAYLSLYTGVPVVPMYCTPLPGGRYRLCFKPAIAGEGEGEEAEAELTARYLADVEEEIRRRPEYWLWMHRRWVQ